MRANCAEPGVDKEFWFSADYATAKIACIVCADCPVRRPCLEDGLHDPYGVWGGWTLSERQRLRRQVRSNPHARSLLLDRAAELGPRALRMTDPTPDKEN